MLRPYQKDAFKAIKADLKLPGSSLCVMPTGSGKSHVIAALASISPLILILQPSQELLRQNREKLEALVGKNDIGTYSAAFNERTIKKFTFATIQSVYQHPELFAHIPLVAIDEAHGLDPKVLDTMYMSFLKGMGEPKVFGFTDTPYRLEGGYQWVNKEGKMKLYSVSTLQMLTRLKHKKATSNFWKRIIYDISYAELLKQGYLSPIQYIHSPLLPYAEIPVNKSHSDYDLELYGLAVVGLEADILRTVTEAQRQYKSVLVFCATTLQAMTLQRTIKHSEIVLGETDKKERKEIIEKFKSGKIKTIFNVGTLTTGFDYPGLDCIILLRPTRSMVLYKQILGRLSRIFVGKLCGTIIDLTGTCKALGRIETFQMYQVGKVWDLRTEKRPKWHNTVLFSRRIEPKIKTKKS